MKISALWGDADALFRGGGLVVLTYEEAGQAGAAPLLRTLIQPDGDLMTCCSSRALTDEQAIERHTAEIADKLGRLSRVRGALPDAMALLVGILFMWLVMEGLRRDYSIVSLILGGSASVPLLLSAFYWPLGRSDNRRGSATRRFLSGVERGLRSGVVPRATLILFGVITPLSVEAAHLRLRQAFIFALIWLAVAAFFKYALPTCVRQTIRFVRRRRRSYVPLDK